jgi:hypothetical protein
MQLPGFGYVSVGPASGEHCDRKLVPLPSIHLPTGYTFEEGTLL